MSAPGPSNTSYSARSESIFDVKIHAGGQTFQASRKLLCSKSPVFKAMFKHDSEESRSNCIKIKEFEINVVKEFLRYVHTGKLDNYEIEMYRMADYYDMEDLKLACHRLMERKLCIVNALDYYALACNQDLEPLRESSWIIVQRCIDCTNFYEYYERSQIDSLPELKTFVLNFVSDNLNRIWDTEEWRKLPEQVKFEAMSFSVSRLCFP